MGALFAERAASPATDLPFAWHHTINQAPMGKQRPRAASIGGHARMFTPTATRQWEHFAAGDLRAAWSLEGRDQMDGPLALDVVAVFPRTTALLTQSKRDGRYKFGTGRLWMPARVDADNIAKIVCDAMQNAAIFANDCVIVDLTVRKFYAAVGETPHVAIILASAARL